MKKGYCVFLGDIALDEYYKTSYWPAKNEKLIVESLGAHVGGMIANAASVYASYGGSALFISILNKGEITQKLTEDLNKSGINTDYILYDDSLNDSKTIIFLTEGEHTVFIPNLGINRINITLDVFKAMKGAKWIYTTISELKRLKYNTLEALDIIKELKSSGVQFVCDLDVAHLEVGDEKYIKELDILFFNQIGFNKYRKGASYQETITKLLNYGINIVVITLGPNGSNIHTNNESLHIPGIPVEVIDVTGAGDTYCSSFIYALDRGNDLHLAASFANAAATRSITKMGPRGGVTESKTVMDFMKEKGFHHQTKL